MSARWLFTAIGALALAAGAALWFATRPAAPSSTRPAIAPAALYAATFRGENGAPQALGQFQGKVVVLNFWATWCTPCREEMPAFTRLQSRWASRGVQFVGLSDEQPEPVAEFGRKLQVNYPLWTGDGVGDLGRRLGNRLGVLPYTVLLGPGGEVLATRVGAYSESALDQQLAALVAK